MITWWCTALERPWTWQWVAYPGIWVATLLPLVAYLRAVRRHPGPVDKVKTGQFVAGVVVFWLATDWPLGALSAGYLASAHMVQFLLYTLVAARPSDAGHTRVDGAERGRVVSTSRERRCAWGRLWWLRR